MRIWATRKSNGLLSASWKYAMCWRLFSNQVVERRGPAPTSTGSRTARPWRPAARRAFRVLCCGSTSRRVGAMLDARATFWNLGNWVDEIHPWSGVRERPSFCHALIEQCITGPKGGKRVPMKKPADFAANDELLLKRIRKYRCDGSRARALRTVQSKTAPGRQVRQEIVPSICGCHHLA